MKILGIDPGVTTGFALYDSSTEKFVTLQVDTTRMSAVQHTLVGTQPDQLVYEDFKHRPNLMKAELHSLKVIGVIELYAEVRLVPVKAKYLPGYAKKFWTDDKLKKLDLYVKGQPHAMDAMRALLCFLDDNPQWFKSIIFKLK
jgi:hypothetical protein